MAAATGYVYRNIEVEAHAGTNEFELRLERMTCLRPILRDGATEIPWPGGVVPRLVPLAGQEERRSYSNGEGWLRVHAASGGPYRMVVPEIPGFEPVPDSVVELTAGQETERVIELRRKR